MWKTCIYTHKLDARHWQQGGTPSPPPFARPVSSATVPRCLGLGLIHDPAYLVPEELLINAWKEREKKKKKKGVCLFVCVCECNAMPFTLLLLLLLFLFFLSFLSTISRSSSRPAKEKERKNDSRDGGQGSPGRCHDLRPQSIHDLRDRSCMCITSNCPQDRAPSRTQSARNLPLLYSPFYLIY